MSKNKYALPVAALILANVLWGLNTPLLKLGVESIPPTIFTAIRFSIVALVLLPFALRTWRPLKRRDYALVVLSSVFNITFSALMLNVALKYTSVGDAAIIGLLSPLLLVVLSVRILRERLNFKTLAGILIALVGSLVIIGKPWEGVNFLANLLVLLSVICGVISVIISKSLASKTSAFQLTFLNILPGTTLVALYAIALLPSWDIATTTSASWYAIAGSTGAVLFANFIYYWALRRKKAQETGIYAYLQPVVALFGGWLFFSEQPTLAFIGGALLVGLGIVVVESQRIRFRKKI